MEGVLPDDELLVGQFGVLLSLLSRDAPHVGQIGAQHVFYRDVTQAQGRAVVGDGLHVQGVVIKQDAAIFNGIPKTAAHHGITGVGDIGHHHNLHAARADEHIHIAAGGPPLQIELPLALTDDLPYQGVGPPIGHKTAQSQTVPVLYKVGDGLLSGHNFGWSVQVDSSSQ